MGCHTLLQGIFLTLGSNLSLPHCRQTLYCLSHQESPAIHKEPSVSQTGNPKLRVKQYGNIVESVSSACLAFPTEPNSSSQTGSLTLPSASRTASPLAHFRKAMPTSTYTIISKHLKSKYSALRLLGLGRAQTKRHPLLALVKCKSGGRDTCAHKRRALSADLSYCRCVNQAGAGPGPEVQRCPGVEVTGPPAPSPGLLFYFTTLLFLPPGLYLFTATHAPNLVWVVSQSL